MYQQDKYRQNFLHITALQQCGAFMVPFVAVAVFASPSSHGIGKQLESNADKNPGTTSKSYDAFYVGVSKSTNERKATFYLSLIGPSRTIVRVDESDVFHSQDLRIRVQDTENLREEPYVWLAGGVTPPATIIPSSIAFVLTMSPSCSTTLHAQVRGQEHNKTWQWSTTHELKSPRRMHHSARVCMTRRSVAIGGQVLVHQRRQCPLHRLHGTKHQI